MQGQTIGVLVIKQLINAKKPESLTSQCGLKQVISDQSHILESSLSGIDLIFTSQPNLEMNSGVYSSLHPNYDHQIIHAQCNLNNFYSLPYQESSGTMKM